MDLQRYRELRQRFSEQEPKYRALCLACLQPDSNCYCKHIRKFDPAIKFVILIHPLEMRRRIATGRMSHLCLHESELIVGHDYSANRRVNAILQNPAFHPVILYPGQASVNLTGISEEGRGDLFPVGKKPLIFVVDGTWSTAKKMVRLSQNLKNLPQVCFSPPAVSSFRVRKQPKPECYSTLEAIHHTIELLGRSRGYDISSRQHDNLLHVFRKMVEQQLQHVEKSPGSRHQRGSRGKPAA